MRCDCRHEKHISRMRIQKDPVDEKLFEICAEQFVRQQAAVDFEQSQRIERVIFRDVFHRQNAGGGVVSIGSGITMLSNSARF